MNYLLVMLLILHSFHGSLLAMQKDGVNKDKNFRMNKIIFDDDSYFDIGDDTPKIKNENTIFGFDPKELAGIAPVAMTMYCFNQHPKLTMIVITSLLLAILINVDDVKKKVKRIKRIFLNKLRIIRGKTNYFWHQAW